MPLKVELSQEDMDRARENLTNTCYRKIDEEPHEKESWLDFLEKAAWTFPVYEQFDYYNQPDKFNPPEAWTSMEEAPLIIINRKIQWKDRDESSRPT